MTTHFNDALTDGDAGNAANYDNGAPTASDDVVWDAVPTQGTIHCLNFIAGTVSVIDGSWGGSSFSCTVHGQVRNFNIAAAMLAGSFFSPSSGTFSFSGCIVDADLSYPIASSSLCHFSVGIASAITDDGSAAWDAVTFSGAITAPAMTGSNAATFSGAVTCPSINMPSASFTGSISQSGASVTLVFGSIGASIVTWTSVTSVLDV